MDGMNRSRSPRLHLTTGQITNCLRRSIGILLRRMNRKLHSPLWRSLSLRSGLCRHQVPNNLSRPTKQSPRRHRNFPGKLDIDKIEDHVPAPKKRKKVWLIILVTFIMLIIAALAAVYSWYQSELAPVSTDTTKQHVSDLVMLARRRRQSPNSWR